MSATQLKLLVSHLGEQVYLPDEPVPPDAWDSAETVSGLDAIRLRLDWILVKLEASGRKTHIPGVTKGWYLVPK